MRRTITRALAVGLLLTSAATPAFSGPAQQAPASLSGTLEDGAEWVATVPRNWNGTLLLWSHGYTRDRPKPEDAPAEHRDALLAAGYALVGSTYSQGGWAIESAVPGQIATVAAFTKRYGKPKRVIAWGMSMGGLITVALAEHRAAPVNGGLALCGSIGGAVGMMNMALDGAYSFRTLVAPDAGIELTGIKDDGANAKRVARALAAAQASPQGRARVALAAVLAGLPDWTVPGSRRPAAADFASQQEQMAKVFVMGVFLPRADQEARAGGVFSWNNGINYRKQLDRSGRRAMVEALYRAAGIDLEKDLARLDAGRRVTATAGAVRYMLAHYTPNGRPRVPVLAVQNVGDGLTSPSLQRDYVEAVARRAPGMAEALWTAGAGHCAFETTTILTSLEHLEHRLDGNSWPSRPSGYVAASPPPLLRPCVRNAKCR